MKLEILGNSGSAVKDSYTSCALIDDAITIDAGTGLHTLSYEQMLGIQDVLLTHTHCDHIAMLCFWLDLHATHGRHVRIHCLRETADTLRAHVFNNQIWPDMEKIIIGGQQALTINYLTPFETVEIAGRRLTPLPVEHGVPTIGFCLHGARENFVFCFDMIDAPDTFWRYLAELDNFKQMAMEVSFSNDIQSIADASGHLTPKTLRALVQKLPPDVKVYYNHAKAGFDGAIEQQIKDLFQDRPVHPLQRGDIIEI